MNVFSRAMFSSFNDNGFSRQLEGINDGNVIILCKVSLVKFL